MYSICNLIKITPPFFTPLAVPLRQAARCNLAWWMLVKWSSANALELILAKLTFNYVFLKNHGDLSLGMETTLNSCDKQGNAASETEFFASRSMY